MEWIDGLFSTLSMYLWGWPMIILLLGTHLYLTVLLKFPQRKIFKAIRLSVKKDSGSDGDVSQFSSLATSLAATVGTGNIIGVATAVALGGPGAVLWCWLTGVFGIATKYGEGLLAIKYRVRTSNGQMLGGPMYALERGLGMKWLAVLFCVFAAIASLGIGNTVQSNAISTLLFESYQIPVVVSGAVMTLFVALILVFGLKGIARVCSMFVPFMAVFYVLGCIVILIINREFLGETFRLIVTSAFTPRAAGGGFVGTTVLMAARYGIARGLFSNESGMGSAPIVAAAAKTRNPVRQALVSSTGTFWDTVVICAMTGLVLVSSILAFPDIDSTQGAALTKAAFGKIPVVGHLILSFGILTFAFSTILGWYYYGERAVEYLFGKKPLVLFKVIWIIGVFVGAVAELSMLWNMADCMNALMAIPNLISLLLLSGVIVRETRKYINDADIDKFSDDDIPQI
jgi:alanine or glycine:cation symporter, AGCS family